MNKEYKTGKPFFNHWMTVSNHRPFTYPEGKIDIPSNSKSRSGGVKYTDYALKQFFAMAEKQAWFKNTVLLSLPIIARQVQEKQNFLLINIEFLL